MLNHFQKYKKVLHAGVILPNISIDQRFYDELGLKNTVSNYEFLRRLCWKGIQDKGIDKLPNKQEYYSRVKRELETFEELGFVEYVLLNWEVHQFCIDKGIPKGYGRGSCSGSCVLYLCKVTDVDPIKYGLFFERFVSKSRAKKIIDDDGTVYLDGSLLADVDSDISYDRRQEVIQFIEQKHFGRTSKILTVGTLSSKLCIRECAKIVDGLDEDEVKAISDSIPKEFNIPVDIKDAIEQSDKFRQYAQKYPKTIKVAKKLEGLIKNTGVHASGIAICSKEIEELMPVQTTKEGETVSGFEMNDVASLAVKFDILGLKTLTVVDDCCKQLGITMKDLDPENPVGYEPFKNLVSPQGLFQIESDATFRICQKVGPQNLEQLSAVVSLSRPGASQFVEQYVKYVQTGEFQSLHPFLDDVFKETAGIVCYQEQGLKALNKIGFDLESCETCRKIIGKKLKDKMPEWEQKVKDKIKENNLDPKIGEILWKVLSDSANYQFAAVHAIAYSMLTYATVYLKFNHPKQFFLALLKMAKNEQEPFQQISLISQELPLFNIRLLPPDLIKSSQDFSIEGNNIRFGLSAIKGISEQTAEALNIFRGKTLTNKFEIFNEAKEAGLNIGALCSLIQAGCLDSFNTDRSLLMLEAQVFNTLTPKEKPLVTNYGQSFNYDILALLKAVGEGKLLNDKGKPIISDSRLKTLREKYTDYRKLYDHNHQHKKFCEWYFEKKLLGYSYTHNLRQVFQDSEKFTPIIELLSLADKDRVRIVGTVDDFAKAKSKKNDKPYLRINLSDEGGKTTVLFFDKQKLHKDQKPNSEDHPMTMFFKSAELEKDDIIVVDGQKSGDIVFANEIKKIDTQIFSKVSEAKK
jgi:DNA-directed DNA polymerase III PolC